MPITHQDRSPSPPSAFKPQRAAGVGTRFKPPVSAAEPEYEGTLREPLTEVGALQLASRLTKYWVKAGHPQVKFYPKRFDNAGWCVRSNLVGGLPPKVPVTES